MKAQLKFSNYKPLVQHSISTAVTHLRNAALLGHPPSQLLLGQSYLYGHFDPKSTRVVGRKSSVSNSSISRRSSSASTASIGTKVVEPDHTLAKHYLYLAARRGLPEADYEIARDLLFDSSKLFNHERLAYLHAQLALFGGVPQAFGLMGKAHEEGIGCKKDLELAEKYYYDGRKRGDEWAQARSDALLNEGIGLHGNEATYLGGGR